MTVNPDDIEVVTGEDPVVEATEEVEEEEVVSTEPESTEVVESEQEEELDETPELSQEDLQAKLAELEESIRKSEEIEKQARDKAKYWREQAREARADYFRPQEEDERQPPRRETMPPAGQTDGRPQPEQFDTLDQYYQAIANWEVHRTLDSWQKEQQQAGFFQKLEDFRLNTVNRGMEKYEDFEEVAQDPSLPMTTSMLEMMMELERPEDVAYYLGRNPQECLKISRMTAIGAAKELVRIESKISATEASSPPITNPNKSIPPVSKAPPPAKPIKGKGVKVSQDPNQMSYEEYAEWRKQGGDTEGAY